MVIYCMVIYPYLCTIYSIILSLILSSLTHVDYFPLLCVSQWVPAGHFKAKNSHSHYNAHSSQLSKRRFHIFFLSWLQWTSGRIHIYMVWPCVTLFWGTEISPQKPWVQELCQSWIGQSTCYVRMRAWVWISSTHVKHKAAMDVGAYVVSTGGQRQVVLRSLWASKSS